MLVDKGYDPQYGARPMRRAIERLLEDPIAEAILRGDLGAGICSQAIKDGATNRIDFENVTPQPQQPEPEKKKAAPRKKKMPATAAKAEKPAKPRRKKADK